MNTSQSIKTLPSLVAAALTCVISSASAQSPDVVQHASTEKIGFESSRAAELASQQVQTVDHGSGQSMDSLMAYLDTPESPLERIYAPLLTYSRSTGEFSREVGSFPRSSKAANSEEPVVYANVDEINLSNDNDDLLATLRAAAKLHKRILLESDFWSREQVEAVGRKLVGEQYLPHRNSALMLLEWSGSRWEVRRNYDAIVESLGRSNDGLTIASQDKALGGSTKMPLYDFMAATYSTATSVNGYSVTRSSDNKVVVFKKTERVILPWGDIETTNKCKVGWRGTKMTDVGDVWIDIWGQLSSWAALSNPTFDAYNVNIVGQGYTYRFDNLGPWVNTQTANCDVIDITGHSLGGAMSIYHAWRWSYTQASASGLFSKVDDLAAFNSPGVGNASFVRDFNSRVGPNIGGFSSFCRNGDPVNGLPSGFVQQCSFWGVQAHTGSSILKNHDANKWSQCQSLTSC
ncbi:MAG: hypothetical protein JNN30_08910 [Rhodanobacteraceae bacterium]|nr:hypothetical protein [Rhodanobacteraceae bacterium]